MFVPLAILCQTRHNNGNHGLRRAIGQTSALRSNQITLSAHPNYEPSHSSALDGDTEIRLCAGGCTLWGRPLFALSKPQHRQPRTPSDTDVLLASTGAPKLIIQLFLPLRVYSLQWPLPALSPADSLSRISDPTIALLESELTTPCVRVPWRNSAP